MQFINICSLDTFIIFIVARFNFSRDVLSFPTRRSSDLLVDRDVVQADGAEQLGQVRGAAALGAGRRDRKSTRLNSSHVENTYSVFCLKKKKILKPCYIFVMRIMIKTNNIAIAIAHKIEK